VAGLGAQDFAAAFPPEHRLLALVFYRRLEQEAAFARDPFVRGGLTSTSMGGVLNLSKEVTSKIFPFGKSLKSVVEALVPSQLFGCTRIDLRCCQLHDMDADDVLGLCAKAQEGGAKGMLVDLSGNRFSPAAIPELAKICGLGCVDFVYVPEVGHIGAAAELAKALDLSIAQKLIFIREFHLRGGHWKAIVPDEAVEAVEGAHRRYYERNK
jgi:hypothetical protein